MQTGVPFSERPSLETFLIRLDIHSKKPFAKESPMVQGCEHSTID